MAVVEQKLAGADSPDATGDAGRSVDADALRCFVAARDEDAFRALVARHAGWVGASCRRLLGDAALADDATQAVFILLAEQAASIRDGRLLGAWLARTARRVALNVRRGERSRKARERVAGEHEASQRQPHHSDPTARTIEHIETERLRREVDACLDRLSDRQRDAVVRFYLRGQSPAKIAAEVGGTAAAARNRVAKGLASLRRHLSHRGVTVAPVTLVAVLAPGLVAATPIQIDACTSAALGGPLAQPRAQHIARGVLRTMRIKKTTTIAGTIAALCLFTTAIWTADRTATRAGTSGPITTWRGANYDGVMPATGTVREFIYYDEDAHIDEKFRRVKKPGDRFLMQVTQQPGDQKNIVWRTSLPSWGQSAPIVVGDKVFVTCDAILQTNGQYVLVCIDVASGETEWVKPVDHLLAWKDGAKKAKVLQIRMAEIEGWAEAMRVWNGVWWDNDKKGFYGKGRDARMGFWATAAPKKMKIHPDRQAAYDQAVADGYKDIKQGYHQHAGRFGHPERLAEFKAAHEARAHVYSHNKDTPWYGGTMASVVGDGKAVYAVAAPDAVVCYELDGTLRWAADMVVGARPKGSIFTKVHRNMASPILADGKLIYFNTNGVLLFAWDCATGKPAWRTVLPGDIPTKAIKFGRKAFRWDYLDGKLPRCYGGHMGPGGTPVAMTLADGDKQVSVVVLPTGHVFETAGGTCLGWFNPINYDADAKDERGGVRINKMSTYGTAVVKDDRYFSVHGVGVRLWLEGGALRSERLWSRPTPGRNKNNGHHHNASLILTERGLAASTGQLWDPQTGKVLVKHGLRFGYHKYTSGCATADGLLLWHSGSIGPRGDQQTALVFSLMDANKPQNPIKHPNGTSGIGLIFEDGTNEIEDFQQRMIDRFGTNVIHSGWPHPTAFGNYIFIRTNTYLYCIGKGKWRSPW